MKIIRMIKTMSGPEGTYPVGMVRAVSDMTAAMLIGAVAAELAPGVVQPAADPPTGSQETAVVAPPPEAAVAPTPAPPRKKAKK